MCPRLLKISFLSSVDFFWNLPPPLAGPRLPPLLIFSLKICGLQLHIAAYHPPKCGETLNHHEGVLLLPILRLLARRGGVHPKKGYMKPHCFHPLGDLHHQRSGSFPFQSPPSPASLGPPLPLRPWKSLGRFCIVLPIEAVLGWCWSCSAIELP